MYVSKRSSGQKRKEMGEWEQQQKKIARRKSIGEEKESESVRWGWERKFTTVTIPTHLHHANCKCL